jgi:hypothetical protein
MCLYVHEEVLQDEGNEAAHEKHTQREARIICRICNEEFSDKNEMMMHRKTDHIDKVNMCKNILAGINCRKGPIYCWYNHSRKAVETGELSRSTYRNTTTVPAFNEQNFPNGPTPKGAVVGQGNMDLQMIHQTLLTQQQQMTSMMTEIMKLKK